MDILDHLFGSAGSMTWQQELARAALIFVYSLVALRLTGRRTFGKWAPLDIVVSIMTGSNLSRALTGNAPLWGTLAATTLLLALHWLLAHAAARSRLMSRLLEGRPVELAREGRPTIAALHRHAVSEADLHEALRKAGLHATSQTRRIMLEPSGSIRVLKAPEKEPRA